MGSQLHSVHPSCCQNTKISLSPFQFDSKKNQPTISLRIIRCLSFVSRQLNLRALPFSLCQRLFPARCRAQQASICSVHNFSARQLALYELQQLSHNRLPRGHSQQSPLKGPFTILLPFDRRRRSRERNMRVNSPELIQLLR